MSIKIYNNNISNNGGDGIRVVGEPDLEVGGNSMAGNAGHGMNILPYQSVLDQLNLPRETDPAALAKLLQDMQIVPIEERTHMVEQRNIFRAVGLAGLNISTLLANVVAISSSPTVQTIIAKLYGN